MTVILWLIATLIVVLGPIILIHELGHFLTAKLAGVAVPEFGIGFPPRMVRLFKRGETEYTLNWIPFGAFVRLLGEEDPSDPRSLAAQPKRWRIAVLAGGAVLNILLAFLLLWGAYMTGFPQDFHVMVDEVLPDTPAAEVGLQPGDVITAVDGEAIDGGPLQLSEYVRARANQSITLSIRRDEEDLSISAVPEPTAVQELNAGGEEVEQEIGRLGIQMRAWPDASSLQRSSIGESVRQTLSDVGSVLNLLVTLPVRLVQGNATVEEVRPASPIAIGQILTFTLQQSLEWGLWFPVLQTAGLISLALGITNLLPLPALDGGRILFVLIEAIRGKRIDPEKEMMIHSVALLVLLGLMALLFILDIVNPVLPWSLFN